MDKQEGESIVVRQDLAFRDDYINAERARRELGLTPGAMARLLLELGCSAILEKDYVGIDELNQECVNYQMEFIPIKDPAELYRAYKICPEACVSELMVTLEAYRLHKSDWELVKAKFKGGDKQSDDNVEDGRRRNTYLKLIASLYAHLKKNQRGEVDPGAILDFKKSRYSKGSSKSKTALAQNIAGLTDQAGLSVGYRTVEKIIDEIQDVIDKNRQ